MQRKDNGPDWGGPLDDVRKNARVFFALCQVVSMPLAAWTRKLGTWGDRYAAGHMAMGWVGMLLFALVSPEADGWPLLGLWLATAMLLLLHRARGRWLRSRGHWVPSVYSGDSRIPGDVWMAKGHWEVCLAVFGGLALCLWSAPVGAWFVAAGVGQGLTVGLAQDEEKAVVRAARDARFRAQYEMELLRRELGEGP